jgi:hypothetical protein
MMVENRKKVAIRTIERRIAVNREGRTLLAVLHF